MKNNIPYSKKARFHHKRQQQPNKFNKKSMKTVPLSHANYKGKKSLKWKKSGTKAKAIVSKLKKSGRWALQSILIPKPKKKRSKKAKKNKKSPLLLGSAKSNETKINNSKKTKAKEIDVHELMKQGKVKYDIETRKGEERWVLKYRDDKGKWRKKVVSDKRKMIQITQPVKMKEHDNTMTKPLSFNLMKGIAEIGKAKNEYSIGMDFERRLEQPERIAILKGGKTETLKIADFEFYGHSHPDEKIPRPSTGDLRVIQPLEPTFTVAGKSGSIHIYNLENRSTHLRWWRRTNKFNMHDIPITNKDIKQAAKRVKYKDNPKVKEINNLNITETKLGRDLFFDITGVKIYTLKPETTIEVRDDPHIEKKMPNLPKDFLERYHKES